MWKNMAFIVTAFWWLLQCHIDPDWSVSQALFRHGIFNIAAFISPDGILLGFGHFYINVPRSFIQT